MKRQSQKSKNETCKNEHFGRKSWLILYKSLSVYLMKNKYAAKKNKKKIIYEVSSNMLNLEYRPVCVLCVCNKNMLHLN